jgi:hypothetical protein
MFLEIRIRFFAAVERWAFKHRHFLMHRYMAHRPVGNHIKEPK